MRPTTTRPSSPATAPRRVTRRRWPRSPPCARACPRCRSSRSRSRTPTPRWPPARSDKLRRDLLEVTLIEGGGPVLARTPVALAPLVEEVQREHETAARERDIELGVQLDPAAVSVAADRERLRQVLGILIANV